MASFWHKARFDPEIAKENGAILENSLLGRTGILKVGTGNFQFETGNRFEQLYYSQVQIEGGIYSNSYAKGKSIVRWIERARRCRFGSCGGPSRFPRGHNIAKIDDQLFQVFVPINIGAHEFAHPFKPWEGIDGAVKGIGGRLCPNLK